MRCTLVSNGSFVDLCHIPVLFEANVYVDQLIGLNFVGEDYIKTIENGKDVIGMAIHIFVTVCNTMGNINCFFGLTGRLVNVILPGELLPQMLISMKLHNSQLGVTLETHLM